MKNLLLKFSSFILSLSLIFSLMPISASCQNTNEETQVIVKRKSKPNPTKAFWLTTFLGFIGRYTYCNNYEQNEKTKSAMNYGHVTSICIGLPAVITIAYLFQKKADV